MSKGGWSLVCALLIIGAKAQTTDSLHAVVMADTLGSMDLRPLSTATHFLRFEATALYDATALRNELVTALWRGGTISRELRQRSAGSSSGADRAGYVLSSEISYSWGKDFLGLASVRPRLSVAYNDVLGMRYTNDLYHATFFGNGDHENDVMRLGPSSYEKVRYQTLGFGVEHSRTGSYLMMHVVNGQDLSAADFEQADLYTATDGRYLRLDLNGEHSRSADDGIGSWRSRGIGIALSFRLVTPIHLGKHGANLAIGGTDLGDVLWNSASLRVDRHKTIVYDGIEANDVFDIKGVLLERGALQDTLGLAYEAGAFLRPLPSKLYASFDHDAAFGMRYTAQVDVRNLPGYRPHAVLAARHAFGGNAVRAEVSFGGFGGWRAGLGAERVLCQRVLLALQLPNVIGLVSESARGRAATLTASYAW